MIGLVVALLIFATKLMGDVSSEFAFVSAANFLYTWYFWITIVLFVIIGLVVIGSTFFGTVLGSGAGGKLGSIVGFILGGTASFFVFFLYIIRRLLFLIGAYLLTISGNAKMTFSDFNQVKLWVGFIMIMVAIIWGIKNKAKRRRSSSKT